MRGFVLSNVVLVLAFSFIASNGTAVSTWKKRSCGLFDLFCCHRAQSEPNALENLLPTPNDEKTPTPTILLSHHLADPDVLTHTIVDIEGKELVIKYEQPKPFRVGLDRDIENRIDLITQEDNDLEQDIWNFSPCENQMGYRLPFQENGHTFMLWDCKIANWFFTSDLTGCDVFVARKPGEETKALIIHSNLNKYNAPEDQTENFRIKDEMAEKIVNLALFSGYRLVMRLHALPSDPIAKDYIEKYKISHSLLGSKIFVYGYDADNNPDGHIFFGKDGKFYVRAKKGEETVELKANLE